MHNLVVAAPFEHNGVAYKRGMQVSDPALVTELLRLHRHSVVKVAKPFQELIEPQGEQ
jgi:hypothetical protein